MVGHRVLLYNIMLYAIISIANKLNIDFNYYIYTALTLNVFAILLSTFLYVRYGCFKRMANNNSIKHYHFGRKKRKD